MARVKPAKKKEWSVPQSAEDEATRQVRGLKNPRIQAGLKGRFIYVYIDWDPICRFEYEGSDSVWRFALYRSSTGR
jgi:hypothetical protein